MKDKTLKLITHPLFSGSALMVVGSNAINGMNYIYHFSMGRLLGVSAYGELVALFSFISILSMVPMAFSMVITKFVSSAASKEDIQGFLFLFYKYILLITVILSVLLIILIPFISTFLHIENNWWVVGAVCVFILSLPVMISRSALQGLLKFGALLITLFLENCFKLFLGIILVVFGFSVGGALIGILVGSIVSFCVAYYFLAEYRPQRQYQPESIKPMILYSVPVFVNFISVTLFSNSDLLLVKHFFTAEEAGAYAAAAVLSKVILFGVSPIISVMFPIIAKRHADKQTYRSIFYLTIGIVTILCLIAIIGYTFLSELVIWALFGTKYLSAGMLLSLFSIYISLFSLSTIFNNYFLAIGDKMAVFFSLLAAILQIIGIIFMHDSLEDVLLVSISVSALLLGMLIVYSIYESRPVESKALIGNSTRLQTTKNYRKRS